MILFFFLNYIVSSYLIARGNALRRLPPSYEYRNHSETSETFRRTSTRTSPTTTKDNLISILKQHRKQLILDKVNLPLPENHLVTSLPYLNDSEFNTRHYAGHIPASPDSRDKKFFYWLFEPDLQSQPDIDRNQDDIPLVIWLNGGPACSSMDGNFLENGPFRLRRSSSSSEWMIQINSYSWHRAPAYVLYIDQPVGTGLSFTRKKNYCRNDLEINIDFHYFLQNFFFVFSDLFLSTLEKGSSTDGDDRTANHANQYRIKRPLYITGESHAGHYIASLMDYIFDRNDDDYIETAPVIHIPISGAAIGNGYIDPYHQYGAADMAYASGFIDLAQKETLDYNEKLCHQAIDQGDLAAPICYSLQDDIVYQSFGANSEYITSMYDTRRWERRNVPRSFPPGHKDVEMFLGGRPGTDGKVSMVDYKLVLKAIHAEESIDAGLRYEECTDPPYFALEQQDGLGVVPELVRVLNHSTKPRILFYNGMNDIICNHFGNERVLENLPWNQVRNWTLSPRFAWDGGQAATGTGPAGYVKEYENLVFLKLMNSSHMVPMDSPELSLEMIKIFLYSGNFRSSEQILPRALPSGSECNDCEECADPVNDQRTNHSMNSRDFLLYIGLGFMVVISLCLFTLLIRKRRRSQLDPWTRLPQQESTNDNEPHSEQLQII